MSRAKATAFALPLLSAALLAGCASTGDKQAVTESEIEQAMAETLEPATEAEIEAAERADPLARANFWAKEFRKDPTKLDVTLQFLEALRAIGSQERAIEVAAKTMPLHPKSAELKIVMARALMSEGRANEAADAYYQATTLAPGNAAAFAGLGLALDYVERHADAQAAYTTALEIDPQRTSTLSNYGLSLALSGNLDKAETRLREAASMPDANARVRQNLALILGLQGKFEAAREIDPHAPKRKVEENMQALKDMLSPVRDYGTLREDQSGTSGTGQPELEPEQQQAAAPPQLRGSLGGS